MKKYLVSLQTVGLLALSITSAFADVDIKKPTTVTQVDVGGIIGAAVGIIIIIASILAFVFLILGGIQWITSGGDKAGMEAARNKITNAIVGLIIVASAWAIMALAGQFIGVNFLGGAFKIPTIGDPQRAF